MTMARPEFRVLTRDEPRRRDQHEHPDPGQSRTGMNNPAWRWGGAALLIVISVVHLHLWLGGYRYLSTIGPLFLLDVIAAAVLAVVVAVRLNAVVAFAAVSLAAGTLGANILSLLLPHGLFHFKEVGVSYSGGFAIASEAGVVMLLGTWTYLRWRRGDLGPRRRRSTPRDSSEEQPVFLTEPEIAGRVTSAWRPDATPLHASKGIQGRRKASTSTELRQREEHTK